MNPFICKIHAHNMAVAYVKIPKKFGGGEHVDTVKKVTGFLEI